MEDVVDLQKLKIPLSWNWRLRNTFKMGLQKLEHKFPIIGKGFRFIGYRLVFLGHLGEAETKRLASIKLLHSDRSDAQKFGSSYGYVDEVSELEVAYQYWEQLNKRDCPNEPSESWALYQDTITKISNLLSSDKKIKRVFNFGVSFAYVDNILAEKHPDVQFLGIDRSKYTKLFNEDNFSRTKNMNFITGDVFEYLKDKDFSDAVFVHARTLVYLPTSFIERLYRLVKSVGFRYIVGFEQVGVSRETFKPFEFSYEKRPSVLFRNNFFIHNYPALLKDAGYKLQAAELIRTNHFDEDFRVMSFCAKID